MDSLRSVTRRPSGPAGGGGILYLLLTFSKKHTIIETWRAFWT